jgi:hypothetical protein
VTPVSVVADDLLMLRHLTPDLDFDDAERAAALLEAGSRDFNAVPGSGKTSLLAAKLLLLAHKWPHQHKGVCILSHTNVAREEITRRLARSDEGSRLLSYPHFIGTIHGFVNQFLSLTVLRTLGVQVDVIDDEVFAKRAAAKLAGNRFFKSRAWLGRQANGDGLLARLRFRCQGGDLLVFSEGGDLPSEASDTGQQLRLIKNELAGEGLFRHCDMFAFAELGLARWPHLLDVVHRRFPMVFVDEMQDTSAEQERMLNLLFDGRSVMQRFGDIDQKIITNDGVGECSFPREGHGTIRTSKRFGARIAHAVGSVRVSGLPVIGEAVDDVDPVLLLYRDEQTPQVIRRFGHLVAERFDAPGLEGRIVRAMCARKSVDGGAAPGRHLGEYWPAYAAARDHEQANAKDGIWRLLERASSAASQATLAERAGDVRKALLLVLRAAGASVVNDVRDGRGLVQAIAAQGGDAASFRRLIASMALDDAAYDTAVAKSALVTRLHGGLSDHLPPAMTAVQFAALDPFAFVAGAAPMGDKPTVCEVVHDGRSLAFALGTVAGMKGETHLASLVLECYGGRTRKFDVEVALGCIAGLGKGIGGLSVTQKEQMRSVYVAMSRPTRFLCLAANEARVATATRDALVARGWRIEQLA